MPRDLAKEESNKALVRASFDRWRSATGGPFELLAPDAEWTIVGSSPLSKTPLVPTIRGIYADGDTVIILFDASATVKDGTPYHNTYTWYFDVKDAKVAKAIAFVDTREFDEFWNRVSPDV
jgi:ketosteroid isomerase-like protein